MGKQKQRGHNEGSIYQRTRKMRNGTERVEWVASVNLGYGPDGKRKRKVIYGETRKEVADKLTVALRSQQLGVQLRTSERLTVGKHLTDWLATKRNIRPATRKQYKDTINLHLIPGLGRHLLTKLEPQHIREFMQVKEAAGLSTTTVKLMHSVLRSALSQAEADGLVPRNVAKLVTPPAPAAFESQSLTVEQARQFLAFTSTHRLSALYSVALALGLRRGECLALSWRDINFEVGTLSVTGTLMRLDGALRRSEPKTKGSKRTITLPPALLAALRSHRVKQMEEKLRKGKLWKGNKWDLVFTSIVGTAMDPSTLNVQLGQLLAACGLPHIRLHDCRHTAATLLLAQGIPVNVVSQILGHSNPTITLNVYAKVLKTQQEDAARQMDDLFFGAG